MKKAYLILFLQLLMSCASQLYVPLTSVNSISVKDLRKGRELYVNNCASCHQLYSPEKYSHNEWVTILNEMQSRAKISDTDKQLVYQYLINAPSKI